MRKCNISQTCFAYMGDNAISTLQQLSLGSTGGFEMLGLLRFLGMEWSINLFCLLLFGGEHRKQSPRCT